MSGLRPANLVRVVVHLLVLRPFVWLFCGLRVTGKANLRQLDRYVIIANHNSHADTLLLFSLLPVKHISTTHPVADRDYFSRFRPVFRLVEFLLQPIWVERGRPRGEEEALGEIGERIRRGHNVMLYPEGTRGEPGQLLRFKSGIGRLATRFPDLPVVPVFLSGPERVLPRRSALPLPFCNHAVVGPPRVFHARHRDITRALERTITELYEAEFARRHRRREAPRAPLPTIAVLGIDGSGKSTVSRAVSRRLSENRRVCLVSDRLEFLEEGAPMPVQPLLTEALRRFIGSRAKKARSLKGYKIPKLVELLLRDHLLGEVRRWYRPDVIVLDGSPLLNMVAWAVLYRETFFNAQACAKAIAFFTGGGRGLPADDPIFAEFPELNTLKRLRLNPLTLPDAAVFIDVPPGTACNRIAARGERRQVHETEERLAKLRDAYGLVCEVVRERRGIEVTRVNGEDPPEKVAAAALEFLRERVIAERAPNGHAH
jgi:1-acyl-sn-glycerol-3-phosphate acyltransferase